MLNDVKTMIDYVKEVSSIIYGKDVFFYDFDEDTWYSRDHCRNVEFSEIVSWLRESINPMFSDEYEEDLKHLIKYRLKDADNAWIYKEVSSASDCLEFLETINEGSNIEYKVFSEAYNF